MSEMSEKPAAKQPDKLVEHLLKAAAGTFDIITVYIGHKLGLYQALSEAEWLTSVELATRTGTQERYIREWLEQQTVTGLLDVQDPQLEAKTRKYHLPAGYAEVLVNQDSLNYLAPLALLLVGSISPLPALLEAYRNGGGVPYGAYGTDMREGQASMNRAMFLQQLGTEWLPSIEQLHHRLLANPPARIADIGCGAGWSSIGMAQAYPQVVVDGYDLDEPSIELANLNLRQHTAGSSSSLEERVTFQVRDASDPQLAGQYDLVTAFECLHDMSDPVGVLKTIRQLVADTGFVLVVDERVGDSFTRTGNEVEWMMYGWSVLHCLPVGMSEQPSAQTGTVMRPDTLRTYAKAAGFQDIEILSVDNYFFRFYHLKQ